MDSEYIDVWDCEVGAANGGDVERRSEDRRVAKRTGGLPDTEVGVGRAGGAT